MFMIWQMGSRLPAPSHPHYSCSATAHGLGVYKATMQLSSDLKNLLFPHPCSPGWARAGNLAFLL